MYASRKKKGLAVIHLTFEGLQVGGGGVCTVNRGHLAALPGIKEALLKRGVDMTPFFCETLYGKGISGFDENSHIASRKTLEEMGGGLFYILNRARTGRPASCNWPGGENFFGTAENTLAASVSGATLARNIALSFERAVVYCDDAAFVMAPLIGAMQANDEKIQWIWVVHSTTHTHDEKPLEPGKFGMEAACVNASAEYSNVRIGAISGFIKKHLIEKYSALPERIVPCGNGVAPLDEKYRIRTQEQIREKIESVNSKQKEEDRIPLDKALLLSFGRPVPYKRLALTLRAAETEPGLFHPVVVTLGEYPELRKLRHELKTGASIINAFDFELISCLCQHEKTAAIAILAHNEPFGLIPSEARLLARLKGGILLLPEDGGGLAEQVQHGKDGFLLKAVDQVSPITDAVKKVMALKPDEADSIRNGGVNSVFEGGYTWSSRIMETLSLVDEKVAPYKDEVITEISKEEKRALGG